MYGMYSVTMFHRDRVSADTERTETFQHAQQIAATRLVQNPECSDTVITDPNGLVLEHITRRWNAAGVEQPLIGYTRTIRLAREQLEIAAASK